MEDDATIQHERAVNFDFHTGAYYYLGVGTGSVVAGRIIRARGYEFLYEAGASAMIAWAAVWAVLLAFASRRRRPADSLREGLLDGVMS